MAVRGRDILHELPGSPSFRAWESPAGTRGPRFAIIEPGAGPRGTGKRRGTTRTLADAQMLAAMLEPSTPAEILAGVEVHGAAGEALLATLTALGEPGTPLWVLCGDGTGYEAVSGGLAVSAVEAVFGHGGLGDWLIRWTDPDGAEVRGLYAVALEDAERAWWVLDEAGRVVAGGPPIYDEDRACEIAADFGGRAVHGTASLIREPQ